MTFKHLSSQSGGCFSLDNSIQNAGKWTIPNADALANPFLKQIRLFSCPISYSKWSLANAERSNSYFTAFETSVGPTGQEKAADKVSVTHVLFVAGKVLVRPARSADKWLTLLENR